MIYTQNQNNRWDNGYRFEHDNLKLNSELLMFDKTSLYIPMTVIIKGSNLITFMNDGNRMRTRYFIQYLSIFRRSNTNYSVITHRNNSAIWKDFCCFIYPASNPSAWSPLFVLAVKKEYYTYNVLSCSLNMESINECITKYPHYFLFMVNKGIIKERNVFSNTARRQVIPIIKNAGIRIEMLDGNEIMRRISPIRNPIFSTIKEMKETKRNLALKALKEMNGA